MEILLFLSGIGISAILYAISRLLNYWLMLREDAHKDSFADKIIAFFSMALFIVSLLVSLPIFFIEALVSHRSIKKTDHEKAIIEYDFMKKCDDCPYRNNKN